MSNNSNSNNPTERNTKVFEYYVIYGDIVFDMSMLPEDESLVPSVDFYRMLVAASFGSLSLEQVVAQATKMGY